MTEPLVNLGHALQLRRTGRRRLCLTGIQAWCARHGVPWQAFAGAGVPGETFAAIGDAYALRALAIARAEQTDQGAAYGR